MSKDKGGKIQVITIKKDIIEGLKDDKDNETGGIDGGTDQASPAKTVIQVGFASLDLCTIIGLMKILFLQIKFPF